MDLQAIADATFEKYIVYIPCDEFWGHTHLADDAFSVLGKHVEPLLTPDQTAVGGQYRESEDRKTGFFMAKTSMDNGPEWVAKSYLYSNVTHVAKVPPQEWMPFLEYAESRVHNYHDGLEKRITNFHVNKYTIDGILGYHSDALGGMDPESSIVSLSFGTSRIFRVAVWCAPEIGLMDPKKVTAYNKTIKDGDSDRRAKCFSKDFLLNHGDCIVMLPGCQDVSKHSIIAARKAERPVWISDKFNGIRYNVTLRRFVQK